MKSRPFPVSLQEEGSLASCLFSPGLKDAKKRKRRGNDKKLERNHINRAAHHFHCELI